MRRVLLVTTWLLAALGVVAVPVRVATFNVEVGMDPPGSAKYEVVKAVLARVDADIVAFQELNDQTRGNWESLAVELGYPHVVFGANTPTMSGGFRVGYFSRHPVRSSFAIQSPPGANELTRSPLRLVVDIPGAVRPLVLWNMHHKASGGGTNQFRRAIEARRIVQNIDAYRAQNPDHSEFVMLGDLNADVFTESQPVSFSSLPGGLPSSYSLGSDVLFPVAYRVFPDQRYGSAGGGLTRLDAFQQGSNSRVTFVSRPPGTFNSTLDYILVSDALLDSPLGAPAAEVYNSARDVITGGAGLPKAGAIPPSTVSRDASDHYLVFADIQMEDAYSPGSRFREWSGGVPPAPALLLSYAIGGAAGIGQPGQPSQLGVAGDWLTLTAIIRTNDPDLTVTGQQVAHPADFAVPGTITTVPGVAAADQSGVPEGCQRREFRVPIPASTPVFLRITATLAGAEE